MRPRVFLLMLLVYLVMPSFWVSLSGQFRDRRRRGGGTSGAIRVKTLGPRGICSRKAIQAAGNVSKDMEERKNARQVQLTYLRHDNTPMPLPGPQDPLAAGLGTADAIVIQALMRRWARRWWTWRRSQSGYTLNMVTDGVRALSRRWTASTAEAAIQALKVLAGLSAEERRRPQTGIFRSRDAEGSQTVWTVRTTSGSVAGERVVISANEKGQWDIPLEQLRDDIRAALGCQEGDGGYQGAGAGVRSARPRADDDDVALVKQHDAFTNSVQALEVNSQAEMEGVTVNKFDPRAGAEGSYSKLLNSIMLKDPNILLVSQVPDQPTADLITRYAGGSESGEARRVYTTIPALDSFSALETWLSLNSDKRSAANSLRVIIAQRGTFYARRAKFPTSRTKPR